MKEIGICTTLTDKPDITFNLNFVSDVHELGESSKSNRIDVMQTETDEYNKYLYRFQLEDKESASYIRLCVERKIKVSETLSNSCLWWKFIK